jgi:hypothetical protein
MFGKLLYWWRGEPEFCRMCGSILERHEKAIQYDEHTRCPKRASVRICCPCSNIFHPHDIYAWEERL